jgi:ABC-type antimicrobial peptide transport system permease subunit
MEHLTSAVRATFARKPGVQFVLRVLNTQIRESLVAERLMATLSGFFGFLAALLATVGLYGVISYMVARRVNEIGIRMALGAERRNVLLLILREAGWLLAVGLGLGTALALGLARTASSLLYGLRPNDPMTILAAVTAMAVVALGASYVPARRAARLEPMRALREE